MRVRLQSSDHLPKNDRKGIQKIEKEDEKMMFTKKIRRVLRLFAGRLIFFIYTTT